MVSFPLFKLGALLAKQISKPLSKILKEKAKKNSFIRQKIVIPPANVYHKFNINIRMRLLGLGSPDTVKPLTEKAAIELGADLISDFFVFGTAAGAIFFEYLRQSNNTKAKQAQISNKVNNIDKEKDRIYKDVENQAKLIQSCNKSMDDQKKKFENLNSKILELKKLSRIKQSVQCTQTTSEKLIGKIMYPSNSAIKASTDVRNSIIYQSANDAIFSLLQTSLS